MTEPKEFKTSAQMMAHAKRKIEQSERIIERNERLKAGADPDELDEVEMDMEAQFNRFGGV